MNILQSKKSLDDYFKEEIDELFFGSITEYLELIINEKKLKKSKIIDRANLDTNYAYQIFNGTKTKPSRNKLLMIAFGMGLDLTETRKLLKVANMSDLYARNPRDSIIIFCLNKGLKVMEVNEYLHEYNFEILE